MKCEIVKKVKSKNNNTYGFIIIFQTDYIIIDMYAYRRSSNIKMYIKQYVFPEGSMESSTEIIEVISNIVDEYEKTKTHSKLYNELLNWDGVL